MKRFWEKTIECESGCIEWTGAKVPRGYGRVFWRGKPRYAHRVSLEMAGVEVPENLMVLHTCDNPSCVKPEHLRIGTQFDNMRDASRKGRCVRVQDWRGEKNPKAKLTDRQAADIARSTTNTAELATRYGVSRTRIQQIRRSR